MASSSESKQVYQVDAVKKQKQMELPPSERKEIEKNFEKLGQENGKTKVLVKK